MVERTGVTLDRRAAAFRERLLFRLAARPGSKDLAQAAELVTQAARVQAKLGQDRGVLLVVGVDLIGQFESPRVRWRFPFLEG